MNDQQLLEDREHIEIFIKCHNLKNMDIFSKSDPQAILYVFNQYNKWIEYGRTEIIQDNLNPEFHQTFKIEFIFEQQQIIKVEVLDYDGGNNYDFIGRCQTSIANIVGAMNQTKQFELLDNNSKNAGMITLRSEKIIQSNQYVYLNLSGQIQDQRWFFQKSSTPYFKIYKQRENNASPLLVYQSEYYEHQLRPLWKPFRQSLGRLADNDIFNPFEIQIWDFHKNADHTFIG